MAAGKLTIEAISLSRDAILLPGEDRNDVTSAEVKFAYRVGDARTGITAMEGFAALSDDELDELQQLLAKVGARIRQEIRQ